MIYRFCRSVLRILYKLFFRLEASGLEHIPNEGGVLLCSNHITLFDPPTIGIMLKRKVHFMAKQELFQIIGFGWLIRQLGAFPVKRGGVSKESIKTALTLLRSGHVMGIFPEGRRVKGAEESVVGKKGAATFALRSDAAVIPVAIIGTYKLFQKMRVVYGPPVDLTEFKENGGPVAAERATDKIMSSIAELKKL
ncbi:1-acyl-sn-glycerol-3-phosphate acyltransferase [Paenibacillus sp. MBLB2552]|uniref:1-acyl-sn-glycerol-3-phosphate acyltransferase n=1 Tax=Paenibacillus mellifer TaxID=2937794 RepID=A0A9X1XWZ0_9BACL|nr:lysophospholipid acyltransferase family protein [Paenibacillus mellifer]MCK8486316.1 1-acyl-sn-glycerol-3-phosphate acyltransferase [Paenibacillus mellifer]